MKKIFENKWIAALLIAAEFLILLTICLIIINRQQAYGQVSIKIGLVAPFTGPAALSGKAAQRGMILAIEEINARGGVLGRPLELTLRNVDDVRTGETALQELVDEDVVAVFGGVFNSGVADYFATLREHKVPLMITWGSMPRMADNDSASNYTFCMAVNDTAAGKFLARYAVNVLGAQQPAIIAELSDWGSANAMTITRQFENLGVEAVIRERFAPGDINMITHATNLRDQGADAVIMIANVAEGAAIARSISAIGWTTPILSHWSISGGRFTELAGPLAANGVYVVQTFSFFDPPSTKGAVLLDAYHDRYNTHRIEDVFNPVGIVHAYDGMHLLALAMQQAGTTDGVAIKTALETPTQPYEGILKYYYQPFSAADHIAFTYDNLLMAQWQGGHLAPAKQPRLDTD